MLNLRVLAPIIWMLFNLSAVAKAEPIKDLADLSISTKDTFLPDHENSTAVS